VKEGKTESKRNGSDRRELKDTHAGVTRGGGKMSKDVEFRQVDPQRKKRRRQAAVTNCRNRETKRSRDKAGIYQ